LPDEPLRKCRGAAIPAGCRKGAHWDRLPGATWWCTQPRSPSRTPRGSASGTSRRGRARRRGRSTAARRSGGSCGRTVSRRATAIGAVLKNSPGADAIADRQRRRHQRVVIIGV
jgi:hypothetical protein